MVNGSLGARSADFRLVAIASSAGGLRALGLLLAALPPDFRLPVAIVQHVDPNHASALAKILGKRTSLHVKDAELCDKLRPGWVYIAPSNRHIAVNIGGLLVLTQAPPVRYSRPSADVLFESAARNCSGPVIGVVLTGTGSDGSDGARAIRQHGGVVIAQDEKTSEFFGMPHAAIGTGSVDYVLPLDAIADRLLVLTRKEAA